MKARVLRGVEIACQGWLDKELTFEAAIQFLKSYSDDPAVTWKIARETMMYFRCTLDIKKTQYMIMEMRRVEFDRLQRKKKATALMILTRPDLPGFMGKDL